VQVAESLLNLLEHKEADGAIQIDSITFASLLHFHWLGLAPLLSHILQVAESFFCFAEYTALPRVVQVDIVSYRKTTSTCPKLFRNRSLSLHSVNLSKLFFTKLLRQGLILKKTFL
jgi:hypothetical protein